MLEQKSPLKCQTCAVGDMTGLGCLLDTVLTLLSPECFVGIEVDYANLCDEIAIFVHVMYIALSS